MARTPEHANAAAHALMSVLNHEQIARLVIAMLLPAGISEDWDSETIEHVLTPTAYALEKAGIPWIGTATDESLTYWRNIARDFGIVIDEDDEVVIGTENDPMPKPWWED